VIPVERCRECAGRWLAFGRARAAVVYDPQARRLVHAWKERGARRLADAAAALVLEDVPRPDAEGVVALPGDRARSLQRGTHPAEQLARRLAAAWGLPVVAPLERSAGRPRQRGSSLAERRRNVRDAFTARATAPQRLVLVDDVYTTGATADAAARTLRRAGASHVEVVTLARVRRLRL
jgi:ComF family protein